MLDLSICLHFVFPLRLFTGLGALIVRNRSASVLDKCYFGGGTVNIALPSKNFHVKRNKLHERWGIPSVFCVQFHMPVILWSYINIQQTTQPKPMWIYALLVYYAITVLHFSQTNFALFIHKHKYQTRRIKLSLLIWIRIFKYTKQKLHGFVKNIPVIFLTFRTSDIVTISNE